MATILLALLAYASPASASHVFDRFIGGSGTAEGQFGLADALAVDPATGQIYVADPVNNRIQRFNSEGDFELTWGMGVETGTAVPEICTASEAPCQVGEPGVAESTFNDPRSIAISPLNGDLYVAEFANHRIQQFELLDNGTPADPSDDEPVFVRAWGWGVDDGSDEFQICTSDCEAGISGSGVGQIAELNRTNGASLAISPVDGDVFLAETAGGNGEGNRRVQRFNADGSLDDSPIIGSAATFGQVSPLSVAIDSRGILYIGDTESGGEIDRYDSAGVHGPPGFLASIPAADCPCPPALPIANHDRATQGLAVDPDSDGAGSDVDRLFVLRLPDSGNAAIYELSSPGEAVPPSVADVHVGSFFGTSVLVRGLAYDASRDRLYVGSIAPEPIGVGVFSFDSDGTGASVAAEIAPPTTATATSAELSGLVDPSDGLARYRFEYSPSGNEPWESLATKTVSGSGEQAVSATLTGLDPNTLYRVRLVAEKVIDAETLISDSSSETTFMTDAVGPEATTRGTHSFTDTSAWLAADVDPQGTSTTYRFEWGTTTAYENQAPFSDASAGAGNQPKAVLEQVTGLQPNTTYHYRIVAESEQGTAFGADRTFTTRPAFGGFADRAYEQVSPVDKLGTELFVGGYPVSPDGNAAAMASIHSFADAEYVASPVAGQIVYQARRNAAGDGWTTKVSSPPPASYDTGLGAALVDVFYGGPSDSKAVLVGQLAAPFATGLYVRDWSTKAMTGLATGGTSSRYFPIGGSADLSHVVFATAEVLTSDPGVPAEEVLKTYEWVNGTIRLVGFDEAGIPFSGSVAAGRGSVGELSGEISGLNTTVNRTAISDDGAHIFFSTPLIHNAEVVSDETKIYRRSHGMTTTLVSPSQAAAPDPQGPKPKMFLAATPSGDEVFFASSEQLTDDANTGVARQGRDLYRYEASTNALIDISATPGGKGAELQGLLGASDDGEWVYYVAKGQVVPGEGTPGANNIYLWHDDGTPNGETRYIATLGDGAVDRENLGGESFRDVISARVATDGQTLVFPSEESLTGYRNHGHSQLYLYEADADGGQGALSCVSCRPNGSPANGASTVPREGGVRGESNQALPRYVSDDGSRVFFQTDDALLLADTNGKRDVYVWEDGRIDLISSGKLTSDSFLQGTSTSGDDVFFYTREQLVGQDNDDLLDVYDHRVGGGIPQQHPAPPGDPCAGDACKPGLAPQPPAQVPASQGQPGGNVTSKSKPRRCGKGKVRRKGRCVKRKGRRQQANRAAAKTRRTGK